MEELGRAKSVKVQKENTIIVDGLGNKEEIANRIGQIKGQIEETKSDFDREKLQERLAKLSGGVAVIRVGAATETEMKEASSVWKTPWQLQRQPLKRASSQAADLLTFMQQRKWLLW